LEEEIMDHQAFAQLLGNYGEFVGAIAVVATLGYLSVQIRQNTIAMQSSADLEAARHFSEQNIRAALNDDITRIVDIGFRGDVGSLNDDERRRYVWFLSSHLYMADGLWKLYKKGQLSEDAWSPYDRSVRGMLEAPAVTTYLKTGQTPLSDAFREHFGIESPNTWEYSQDLARVFDNF
jgi:hypothetical protein